MLFLTCFLSVSMIALVFTAIRWRLLSRRFNELKETHLRLTQVTGNIQEVFWMSDLAKNQMIYISPAYEKIWGRTCESLYADPRSFIEAIHPEDRARVLEALAGQASGKYDIEYRIVRLDGEVRWIRDRAFTVRNDEGAVYRICGVAADITLQKNLSSTLEAQQEMLVSSSKLTALGEMAGGIAHEINTPLATVIARSGQLEELMSEPRLDRKTAVEIARDISETVGRIAKIVRSLRSFSHDGSQDPFTICSISQIVDETLVFCAERFKEHDIDLKVPPIPENLAVECRPTELSQVLLNLLNNSYDAIASEKSASKWVRLEVQDAGAHVILSVTDSGKGIPPESQARLFQPFFTTKSATTGTGIGLSISRKIARNHGGELELDRTCSNTRFVVLLPKEEKTTRMSEPAA